MSENINDGGSMFPWSEITETNFSREIIEIRHRGMSLRDWFAGQALAGSLATSEGFDMKIADVAKYAYLYADAMIAARSTDGGDK